MLAEIKALEGVTFAPTLSKESTKGAYADIRPRLNMQQVHPEPQASAPAPGRAALRWAGLVRGLAFKAVPLPAHASPSLPHVPCRLTCAWPNMT